MVRFRYAGPRPEGTGAVIRRSRPYPLGDDTFLTHVSLRAGYSTEADIPKIIEIVEGRPVEVLAVAR